MENEPIFEEEYELSQYEGSIDERCAWYQIKNDTLIYEYKYDIFDYDIETGKINNFNCIKVGRNKDFPSEILTEKVKKIIFNFAFIQKIDNLPSHIEELEFPDGDTEYSCYSSFNQPIDYLPYGIKIINFGTGFNQRIDNLPESIEYLTFKGSFNQPIDNLPKNVKEIKFFPWVNGPDGHYFDSSFEQPINNLPEGLEKLSLKCLNFNHPIDNLPKSIKELKLYFLNFSYPLDNLPENLEKFEFVLKSPDHLYSHNLDFLPQKLKKIGFYLKLSTPLDNLPSNLSKIKLEYLNYPIDTFPNSIRKIMIRDFNKPIKKLPINIEYLNLFLFNNTIDLSEPISDQYWDDDKKEWIKKKEVFFVLIDFNQPIDNLPEGITKIQLSTFDQPIKKTPSTLLTIRFGNYFNQDIRNLSHNITQIYFGRKFNQPLVDENGKNILPPQLKVIVFGEEFNKPIENLPKSIKLIGFGKYFDQSIDNLPEGLRILLFGYTVNQIKNKINIESISGTFFGKNTKVIERLPSTVEKIYGYLQKNPLFESFKHLVCSDSYGFNKLYGEDRDIF